MSERRSGASLFRAWSESTPPAFDEAAGRARFLERFVAGKPRSGWRFVILASAPALAGVMAFCGWLVLSTISFKTATGEGQPGAWLATSNASELPLTFSEGTEVVMAADSRGRVEALTRLGASFLLERGQVRAHVVHRSNTSWRFLAGPFEVQVTGTTLGVDWDPARERFAVHVDEGAVVVRGPNVGAPQLVRAGEQCVVDLPSRTTRISPIEAPRATAVATVDAGADARSDAPGAAIATTMVEPPTQAPPSAALATHAAASAPAVSWIRLDEKGDYDAAYTAALNAGLASVLRASSADELLRLAQVARLSGHRDTEREALVTCRRRFPGSERAAVAAYELGRSSSPSEASSWFDTYLGEQPSGPLAREAAGRLVEARASAGDDRGARDAAARYLARYPDGPHAVLARRVLAGTRD